MGDFDRNAGPKKQDQSKQVVLMIGLAVALVGLLGYYLMKPGPQSADASGMANGTIPVPSATLEETPEQVRKDLSKDPTLAYTLDPSRDEVFKTPRNPFVMSESWMLHLRRAIEVAPMQLGPSQPAITSPVVPTALPVTADKYKLSSIIRQQGKLTAVINNNFVTAGMRVDDGAKVIEVTDNQVKLQHPDFPNGPITILRMQ